MSNVFKTLLLNISVRIFLYIDDLLLMGTVQQLELAKQCLLNSFLKFNLKKCVLDPTQQICYLGVIINLKHRTIKIAPNMVLKLNTAINAAYTVHPFSKFWERLLGLLNFVLEALRLPFILYQIVQHRMFDFFSLLPQFWEQTRSFKYVPHSDNVYTDATPKQGAIVHKDGVIFMRMYGPILLTEYLALLEARLRFPSALLWTDNQAALHWVQRGFLPDRLLVCLTEKFLNRLIDFKRTRIGYVRSAENPADAPSRVALQAWPHSGQSGKCGVMTVKGMTSQKGYINESYSARKSFSLLPPPLVDPILGKLGIRSVIMHSLGRRKALKLFSRLGLPRPSRYNVNFRFIGH